MKVGLIRVMTLSSQSALQSHGRLIQEQFPGLTVESVCIENQYKGIYDEASEKQALSEDDIHNISLRAWFEAIEQQTGKPIKVVISKVKK